MFHANHTVLTIAGYIMVGSVFINQAISTLPRERFANHSMKLGERGFPAPDFVLACALAMMLAGGVMVTLDVYARVGALMLIIFTLIATYLYQRFWTIQDPSKRREKRGTFFNNLAILGGLFLIAA